VIDWNNNPRAIEAFDDIKQAVNDCPQLFFPDDFSPIHLYTDASITGVGAYLCQRKEDGKEYPIAFFSKSLSATEKRWGVPELEGYAIYAAFKKFDYLLRDAYTYVHTDHKNLVYIRDSGSDKVLRWKMMLQEYSFSVEHVPGVNNPIADFWSRNEIAEEDDYIVDTPMRQGSNMLCTIMMQQDGINDITMEVQGITKMFSLCSMHEETEEEEEELREGVARYNGQNTETQCNVTSAEFEIPDDIYDVIKQVHNAHGGHHGVEATLNKLLKLDKKWLYMREHIRKFIRTCDLCQKASYLQYKVNVPKYITGGYYPMEKLQIDTVGTFTEDEFGYKYVIVIVDCFSRFMTLYKVKTLEAQEAAEALLNHIGHYGVPALLCSDGGDQYVNSIIRELLEMTGTQHCIAMAYSHQENSIVERANREVNRWLREMLYDLGLNKNVWSRYLPFVQRIHNASPISTIGYAPSQILFGDKIELDRHILIPDKAKINPDDNLSEWMHQRQQYHDDVIKKAQKLQKKHELEHTSLTEEEETAGFTDFPVGSYVLVAYPETGYGPRRPHKLYLMHRGPLQVISRTDNLFALRNLVTEKTEYKNIFLLKPFYWNPKQTTPREVALRDYSNEADVEEILSHHGQWSRKTHMTFIVKWVGHDNPTEEPWINLRECHALHVYLTKLKKTNLIPGSYKKKKAD